MRIALPKGRLFEESVELFLKVGILEEKIEEGRKLTIRSGDFEIFLVKPFDVPIYVENGVADIGVCGYDVLLERNSDVYVHVDLDIGKCKVCVAGKPESKLIYRESNCLRVATKYLRITDTFFKEKDKRVRILQLNGSVELAPVVGLADFIVDLVQTGRTLKENGLVVIDEIADSSARLISNKASFRNKHSQIVGIINTLLQSSQTP